MFSERIIQSNIERFERSERRRRQQLGLPNAERFRLIRFPADIISEMVEHIDQLIDKKTGRYTRDLTAHEQAFIDNELAMCQLDWRYYCENYVYIQLASQSDRPEGWSELESDAESVDDGAPSGSRIGKFILNGMQLQLLRKLARLEELCYEALSRGAPVNGILLILHKARQLGASVMWQALMIHRVNFYSHINALTASIDEKSTRALFRRFERMYDRMPLWMRAEKKRQTVDGGIEFARDSIIDLQSGAQKKDMGKGETWHSVHITECAAFDNPDRHFDEGLFPTIPFSLYTLYGMESTSDGKSGWWYDFVTAVMSGTAEGGAGRFSHYFAPFYLIDMADSSRGQRSKYRIEAPIDWLPSVSTQMMALRVKTTSHLYCDVESLELHRDVLYWYESTRNYYYKRGKLNLFLQNFPVDADESFQHSTAGAFPNEFIDRLRTGCSKYEELIGRPMPYTIVGSDEVGEAQARVTDTRRIHQAGGYWLVPMDESELDRDARGIVFLFEQPEEMWFYVMGADPAGGIPGWRRAFRQHNDINTDNGAVEIFRKGKPAVVCEECSGRGWHATATKGVTVECQKCDGRGRLGGRAIQVAEFAAPVDAEDLALYIFVLGRVFRGNSDMPECLSVVEANNTGLLTLRKLQTVYDYSNLYQHQTIDSSAAPRYTSGIGFLSTSATVPILHGRSRSVLLRRDVEVRSQHLVKEYSDAIVKVSGISDDDAKTKAIVVRERFMVPPGAGRHDDRMTASFLALWALFDWTDTGDSAGESGYDSPARRTVPDLACRDATAGEQQQQWNDLVAEFMSDAPLMLGGHYPDCAFDCTADHPDEGDEEMEWWDEQEEGDDGGAGYDYGY